MSLIPPTTDLTPQQVYTTQKATLREIVEIDHFSNTVPSSIIDLWLSALDPSSKIKLPPDVKGFYGGDLRSSIPIELAHDCYKYVIHETDSAKVAKYTSRMLIALSLLDIDDLAAKDANLAGLALWHTALARVRMPGNVGKLAEVLKKYEVVRPKASLSEVKLPLSGRLKVRLLEVVADEEIAAWLCAWEPEGDEVV